MSVDMFTSLNNDILQCILYEWLNIKDICQLDIAVCNHSIRPLYYETLQSSTLPLIYFYRGKLTNRILYNFLKWSKKREIKNPIKEIEMSYQDKDDLSLSNYEELSNDFKSLKYIESLFISYWNPRLIYAMGSLKCLICLQVFGLNLNFVDSDMLGIFFKQLTLLTEIYIVNCSLEPIIIKYISEISSLKTLEISNKSKSLEMFWLNELFKLNQIESLSLRDCNSNQILDLSCLTTFSYLTKLSLYYCKIYLQHILSLNQLKELKLFEVDDIETNNINYENYLPLYQLEVFEVYYIDVNHNLIQYIFQSKQLKRFVFISRSSFQEAHCFYGIRGFYNLTHLILRNIFVDEQLFDNICQLSQLKRLELSSDSNQINKQNFCLPFSKLSKQLTSLYFKYQPYIINKNTFEEISQLQNLTYLSIDWDLNNLQELQPLSQLKQLYRLRILNEKEFQEFLSEKQKFQIKEMLQLPKLKL